jgi:hypothetical protein
MQQAEPQGHGRVGRMISWLVALALVMLWQPGGPLRSAGPAAGLAPVAQDLEAGQGQRALALARPAADDRASGAAPDMAALPVAPLSPRAALLAAGLRPVAQPCAGRRACTPHQPRAPPAA